MNLFGLLNNINLDKIDADEVKHVASRRGFFTKGADISVKTLLALAPVAAVMMPKVAKAATPGEIEVLNFALTLEYLEDEFYKAALASSALNLGNNRTAIAQISKHETAHVNFLVGALGGAAVSKPNFDFTARGAFAN
ncbi:MAG: ferritin-like domain-containing protein, partial [Flexibacteraceae bacterium]